MRLLEDDMTDSVQTVYDPDTEKLEKINEDLSVIQLKKGLAFGTDSYLVSAFARPLRKGVLADLGGGTGVISLLTLARNKYRKAYCVEIQPYFADLISRNALLNGLDRRIVSLNRDVRGLAPSDIGGEADMVITNPPYMPAGSGFASSAGEMDDARRENNGGIGDFVRSAASLLKYGGYFTAVYLPSRMSELFSSMTRYGIEPKRLVTVYPDRISKPSLILVEGKKGAAPGLICSRPLIIYSDGTREYTPDMDRIYSEFSFSHMF